MAWNKYANMNNINVCVKAVQTILSLEDNKFNRETIKFMIGGIADRRKEYSLSEGAYDIYNTNNATLIQNNKVRSPIKGVTIEHMIPNKVVVDYLYEKKEFFSANEKELSDLLVNLDCAMISKEEDQKLRTNKLTKSMPQGHVLGNTLTSSDLIARYKKVGITIK